MVEHDLGDGRKQNVHTKEWRDPAQSAKIEVRKALSMNSGSSTIIVPRSLGATARKYIISLPSGRRVKLASGTAITKVKVFAGRGTNTPIRVAKQLEELYGYKAELWEKVRGEAIIRDNGTNLKVEIHW